MKGVNMIDESRDLAQLESLAIAEQEADRTFKTREQAFLDELDETELREWDDLGGLG